MASAVIGTLFSLGIGWYYGYESAKAKHPLTTLFIASACSDDSGTDPEVVKKLERELFLLGDLRVSLYTNIARLAAEKEGIVIPEGEYVEWGSIHIFENYERLQEAILELTEQLKNDLSDEERVVFDEKMYDLRSFFSTDIDPRIIELKALDELHFIHKSIEDDFKILKGWEISEKARFYSTEGIDPSYGRIYYINGILSNSQEALETAAEISNLLGNTKVHIVHNPSQGFFWDVVGCVLNYAGTATPPAAILQKALIEYLQYSPGSEKVLVVCHSQGALLTRLALENWPIEHQELLERIEIVAIAPAAYIPHVNVRHYLIDLDWIPTFFARDYQLLSEENRYVEHLPPHTDGTYPHGISGNQYTSVIKAAHEAMAHGKSVFDEIEYRKGCSG